MRLGPIGREDAGEEQHAHGREDGPALALVADHAAEDIGQRSAEHEDREHLHEVGKCGRVFEGVRGVGVEKAAAIGAEHLYRDLRGDRPERDGLLGAFQRRCIDVGAERLRDALPDQKQCVRHADRQQHVERAARDIDPEVADRTHRVPREAANQCHGKHDAGCSRQIVLVGQAEHLHEIRHRAFAAIGLPIGVGDEADRRVEGQVRRHRHLPCRIERQPSLKAQQRVEQHKAAGMEQQHADRVSDRVLLAALVDAGDLVDRGFNGPQDRRQQRALAAKYARHVAAERRCQRDDDQAEEQDLNPSDDSHDRRFLRTARV